jgi:protoheme IX farnesyltransferase
MSSSPLIVSDRDADCRMVDYVVANYVGAERRTHVLGRLADFVELTKPRIASLVLVAVAASAALAAQGPLDVWRLVHTLLGTALIAASASALNQWLERGPDARMPRTADRPLPSGRLASPEALAFGVAAGACGLAYLAAAVGLLTAGLGLLTWLLYVMIYTPLKRRTWLNTVVGAVAGAMPVLMGAAAMDGLDLSAVALFGIVYLWQFPHFMAIAWIYRRQYATAGFRMLSVVDPSGRRAGRQALAAALLLIPVSLVPFTVHPLNWAMAPPVAALGAMQAVCAAVFLRRRDDRSARRLLLSSLIYLPAVLLLLLVAAQDRLFN